MTAHIQLWLLAVVLVTTAACGSKGPQPQVEANRANANKGLRGRSDASFPATRPSRRPVKNGSTIVRGARPQVVSVVSPDGARNELWAAPGDHIAIDKEMPFAYRHDGSSLVNWQRDGDLLRANGKVVAVDLSTVPASQIRSTATAAKKAGAKCAIWRGAPWLSAAQLKAFAQQPIACLGFQFTTGQNNVLHNVADELLPKIVPLAKRIRMLDGGFGKAGVVLLRKFTALRALAIRQQGYDADPMTLETAEALWNTVAALTQLQHLRVGREMKDGALKAGVQKMRQLRRLDLPRVKVGAVLADIVKLPNLVALSATLNTATGNPTSSKMRELSLRLRAPLGTLKGFPNLRILRIDNEIPAGLLRANSKLVVLETGGIGKVKQLPPLPALQILRVTRMHASATIELGPLPIGQMPALHHLELSDTDLRGKRADSLAKSKALKTFICNDCPLETGTLTRLARIKNLRALHFRCSDCPKDAKTLIAINLPKNKPRIQMSKYGAIVPKRPHLTVAAARALRRHGELRELSIPFAVVSSGAVAELGHLTDLTRLNLDYSPITDTDLQQLSRLRNLRQLSLRATRISSVGLAHLAPLVDLRRVDLTANAVDDGSLKTIQQWKKLRWLSLEATLLTGKGMRALQTLSHLRALILAHATVAPGAIARERLPAKLQYLDASAIHLTTADVVAISKLRKLEHLWGIDSNIGTAALRTLASAPRLRTLIIPLNPIRDRDVPLLTRLSHLTRLDVKVLSLSSAKRTAVETALPHVELRI